MELSSMNFIVPYNYLPEQFSDHKLFFDLWKPVLTSGEFTLGPFVENYEKKSKICDQCAQAPGSYADSGFLSSQG